MRWIVASGLAAGCAVAPADGTYVRLRGALDPQVTLDGDDATARILWVTAVDGELCVEVDTPLFVPSLRSYEAEIDSPPDVDGAPCVPSPADLPAPLVAGWGLLVLLDPDAGAVDVTLTADPTTLLGWFAGGGALGDVLRAEGGRVAAAAQGITLGVYGPDPPLLDGGWCRFDAATPGLAIYEDRGTGCGGWSPIARAGERTEVQGVDLVPL